MFQIEYLRIVLGLADFTVTALMVTIPYWFLVMLYRTGRYSRRTLTLLQVFSLMYLLITTFGIFSLYAQTGFYYRYRSTQLTSMLGALNITAYIIMIITSIRAKDKFKTDIATGERQEGTKDGNDS